MNLRVADSGRSRFVTCFALFAGGNFLLVNFEVQVTNLNLLGDKLEPAGYNFKSVKSS